MYQAPDHTVTGSFAAAGSVGRLLLLALLLGLAACGSNSKKEDPFKPAPLVDFEPEQRLKKVWSRSVGDGQGKKFNRLQAALDGEYIYAVDSEGRVYAFDRQSGKKIWKARVKATITGGVGVAGGLVVVGSANGEVFALNQYTGELLWDVSVGGEVLAPPATDGDVVVVQTFDGKLIALNAYSGEELWRYSSQTPVLSLRGTAAPVIDGGRAFAGFANGKLVAVDLDSGVVQWERRVALPQGESEIERMVDVDGSPLLSSTAVFAASYQGRAAALDPESGRPLWFRDVSSYVALTEGFGNVYIAQANGSVLALDQRTGNIRWENETLTYRELSAPVSFGSYIAVADFEGYVHILSQVDGEFVARKKLGSKGVRAPILSSDDIIYVLGNKGKLAAYKIRE
jgi:outer membrane protein assembly factor BamB